MNKVLNLSKKLVKQLSSYCRKIQIAGSIRRGEKNPGDIDIVLIPKNKEKLENFLNKKGKKLQGGEKESTWKIEGIKVELYYTTSEEWGAELLAYSSKKGSGIGLRVIAKKLGFKLTQHGLFKKEKRIAGKTEREIYQKLGRPYKEPKDR
jgi:DNA polymerase (family 10)